MRRENSLPRDTWPRTNHRLALQKARDHENQDRKNTTIARKRHLASARESWQARSFSGLNAISVSQYANDSGTLGDANFKPQIGKPSSRFEFDASARQSSLLRRVLVGRISCKYRLR
jgi:hypothetical protein